MKDVDFEIMTDDKAIYGELREDGYSISIENTLANFEEIFLDKEQLSYMIECMETALSKLNE